MALNLSKAIEQRPNTTGISQNMRSQFNITVNEVAQSHFSVQGVQTYSVEEIKAMRARMERVVSSKLSDGQFIKVKTYMVDDQIDFEGVSDPTSQKASSTLKPKSSAKLEPAKIQQRPKTAKVKASIRNQMTRANQKTVKLTKQQQKLQKIDDRLSKLTQQYKKHFSQDLKVKKDQKKISLQSAKKNQKVEEPNEEPNEMQQVLEQFQDQEGEQALPCAPAKKSIASPTRHDQDDSFEEVDFEVKNPSNSRLNQSTQSYSQRLGNAVHFLFD